MYLAIEGPIGVGKSTLAPLLGEALEAELLLEQVEENAFLPLFYGDRARYAFQTQLSFLLARYRQQQQMVDGGRVVSDYLLIKDRIFAGINLGPEELALYEDLWQILKPQVRQPDCIVLLQAPIDVLVDRIAKRGRPYEQSMDRAYLQQVCNGYVRCFSVKEYERHFDDVPLLIVDSTRRNFECCEADLAQLLAAIGDGRRGIHRF